MKILYIFSSPRKAEEDLVRERKIPSDRLYMAAELRGLGHEVDVDADRYQGMSGAVARWLRRRVRTSAVSLKTLLNCRKYDLVVLKDEFCTSVTLLCRLCGVRLVNLDSLGIEAFPKTFLRRLEHRVNLLLANSTIAYSQHQIDVWSKQYDISLAHFRSIPYAVDISFYDDYLPLAETETGEGDYVLSVGCDAGRDYVTLLNAVREAGMKLKVVSVPARFPDQGGGHDDIEYYNDLSYQELFDLYAKARCVVIPIRSGIIYPCGIRGLLEAMALGKAVIVSRTPILEEYIRDGENAVVVEPEDSKQLCQQIGRLCKDTPLRQKLGCNARKSVGDNYDIRAIGREFAQYLEATGLHSEVPSISGRDRS